MIVSIHQPAYIPWLGYFDKIAKGDIHIFLDDALYSKNNLFNRNKIKTPNGWQWLTIPVSGHIHLPLNEIKIDKTHNWQQQHWTAIKLNYSRSKCFNRIAAELEPLYQNSWEYLTDFNISMNRAISRILKIKTKFFQSSRLKVEGSGCQRLINLCRKFKADTYLSGQGAKKIYMDETVFKDYKIKIVYQQFKLKSYPQLWGQFIPDLSVLDYLFNVNDL